MEIFHRKQRAILDLYSSLYIQSALIWLGTADSVLGCQKEKPKAYSSSLLPALNP